MEGAEHNQPPPIPSVVKWEGTVIEILNVIGTGTFGVVYLGRNTKTNQQVAVKFEAEDSRILSLCKEKRKYQILKYKDGFPRIFHYGNYDGYSVLIMEYLGPTLEKLFNICSRKFSLKTVLGLALQMLDRVETVHSKGLIHRDIKPENFLMGAVGRQNTCYLIDFGLAKVYYNYKQKLHIPFSSKKGLVGTVRYASIRNHLGYEQSRRDDLESLGYIFIYFLKGVLPWQNQTASTLIDRFDMIKEVKMNTGIAELCEGCPDEFRSYLEYCRNLKFTQTPNYSYLRSLFQNLYYIKGFNETGSAFDWS